MSSLKISDVSNESVKMISDPIDPFCNIFFEDFTHLVLLLKYGFFPLAYFNTSILTNYPRRKLFIHSTARKGLNILNKRK